MSREGIFEIVRGSYALDPGQTQTALGVALKAASDRYVSSLAGCGFSQGDVKTLQETVEEGRQLSGAISSFVSELDLSQEIDQERLYVVAGQLASSLRLHGNTLTDERAQTLLVDAFGLVNDIADCSATEFYLGADAINGGQANLLVGEYFRAVPFGPSVYDMQGSGSPIDMVLTDWAAAVTYCRNQGVPDEAFLRDGTNLFRFAPDALPYVSDNIEKFPGLDLTRVNHGPTVEAWLKNTQVGNLDEQAPPESWMVLLTGYTPRDNNAIPGLNPRYNTSMLSTMLSIESRRL